MRDPFRAPSSLITLTRPLGSLLSLRTLPLHAHEILPAFCIYEYINVVVSPYVSTRLFPKTYPHLSRKQKVNWNVHFVSMVQALFINSAALWVIFRDRERRAMGPSQRVWGYTGASGMVQGFAAGYFLWDLMASVKDVDVHGWGALIHAASALAVTGLGFRPFVNYYGINFILYELSTPFLNIHWFMDKVGMTGTQAQLVNGIALIASFGGSRLLWGTYQSVNMYSDIWQAYSTRGENPVPAWLAVAYVVSNTVLSGLNFYWFGRMITTVKKRFDKKEIKAENDGEKRKGNRS